MIPKFRAWHKIKKRMFIPSTLYLRPENNEIWINENTVEDENCFYGCAGKDIELMIFSEFKDRKKVKIFEGDIIAIEHNGKFIGKSLIKWNKGLVMENIDKITIKHHGKYSNFPPANLDSTGNPWNIIGNYFENPELLIGKE